MGNILFFKILIFSVVQDNKFKQAGGLVRRVEVPKAGHIWQVSHNTSAGFSVSNSRFLLLQRFTEAQKARTPG